MTHKNMTQSQINALLNDSDLQSSTLKDSQLQSHAKQIPIPPHQAKKDNYQFESSNQYGDEQFEDFDQSKKLSVVNHSIKQAQIRGEKSSVYESYGNQQFDSYEQSRRTKEFQRSQQNVKFTKKPQPKQLKPTNKQLKPIQEYAATNKNGKKVQQKNIIKKSPQNSKTSIPKAKQNNLIATSKQILKQKNKPPLIRSTDFNQNKNLPYNYNRLQEREKQLLMTTLSEENKKLRLLVTDKDKQLVSVKGKYNILLEEKAHVLGNAKQATLRKQLQQLQKKYDIIVKEKTKQRAFKTVSMQMSKTATNNFVSQVQAEQRQQQLMIIIEKLKQRLVSTDKQLKTLQQKMNQGLDYQEQLHRKLKRVEQLQLRMEKMKNQAQQDRSLIQMLKDKTKQQKLRIQELQQQKNELNLCLKRADLNHATQSDLMQELQQAKRQKQLLEKSLREISMNFTSNVVNASRKQPKLQLEDIIEDSNELLNYKKK